MSSNWYVAKVKRGRERVVGELLQRRGIEVRSPRIITCRNGRKCWEYLFPTYLLCRLKLSSPNWPAVLWLPGMRYFLPKEGKPLPLEEGIVEDIERRVAEWNGGGWLNAFKPQQPVVLTAGALKGMQALFQRYLPAKERCEILIFLLGRNLEVEVELTALRPA